MSAQVVFYTYKGEGEGVSLPNGVLTIEGVVPDKRGLGWLCAAASYPLALGLLFEDAAKPESAPHPPAETPSAHPQDPHAAGPV